MTNLDIAKKYFKEAYFEHNDRYVLSKEFTINHIDSELFSVDSFYFDLDIGPVTDDDLFVGDFRQCLEFCLGEKIDSTDVQVLEDLK